MSKLPDKLPAYYSPRISSELPDCSSPLTFDTYSRCSMRCQYCFSHAQKDVNPGTKDSPLQGVNVDKLFSMIDGTLNSKEGRLFYKYFFKEKFLFHWGGL